MKVGFIGLGGIGKPMAMNVAKAGFDLTVTDLRAPPVAELVALGAHPAASPREVAAAADVTFASLPSNAASEEVAFGADGVLAGAETGDIYVELSTISPEVVHRIAAAASEKGVGVLDAPVSGGIKQRNEGTLSIMVGGDADTLGRARPALEAFGKRIFHAGGSGAGATVKLINNLLAGINMIATMEAVTFGKKAGLEIETLKEIVSASSGNSGLFAGLVDSIMTRTAEPAPDQIATQGLHTIGKDVQLAADLARNTGVPLPLGSSAVQMFIAGLARGWEHHEYWAIMQLFEELAGVQVRPQSVRQAQPSA